MNIEEVNSKLRQVALNEACRHRLATETVDDILRNAQKYYEFLLNYNK